MSGAWRNSEKVILANSLHEFFAKYGYSKIDLNKCYEIAETILKTTEEAYKREGHVTVTSFLDSLSNNS